MNKQTLCCLALLLRCTVCQSGESMITPLNLSALLQPVDKSSFYVEPGYATWDGNLFKEGDRYCLVYSRWKEEGGDWLTTSEVCLAEADTLRGPYRHVKVLLKGRGPGHWDELNAHNPKLKKYGGKYYLYYISSRSGPSRGHVRDSQRTGVAISDSLLGPYSRLDKPIVEPQAPVYNITVNPGVTAGPDGHYLMILKGDKKPKKPNERMGKRVQGIAVSDSPAGPFSIQPELAIAGFDTEDASLWYDEQRQAYFAIYHAHSHVGLITSRDGFTWQPARHPEVMKKSIHTPSGDMMKLNCVERPFVFFENGEPAALCLSVRRGGSYNTGACLIIPLGKTP